MTNALKTLEYNTSHPRKAVATRTAALSDLGFSGRAELNKYFCNSAKKKSAQIEGSLMGFRVTWLHRIHQLRHSSQSCAVPHGMTNCIHFGQSNWWYFLSQRKVRYLSSYLVN